MSITPAFSPRPWITQGALVGSVRRWILEDLYEQCSFHMAEKIPSSVKLGVRPISLRMRSYSSGLRPCSATSSGVIFGSLGIMRLRGSFGLPYSVGGPIMTPLTPSGPQLPFGDGDPLGLHLAHIFGCALGLCQHLGEHRLRLAAASELSKQQAIAHACFRAWKVLR